MFTKLSEINPVTWVILCALIVLIGILLAVRKRDSRRPATAMLAHGAAAIALSFVLSYVRLYRMPQGGSITPASMLPLITFAFVYGARPGLLAGFAYGLLHILQDAWIIHPVQALLDYPLAFAALGLAGLARNIPGGRGLPIGLLIGAAGRLTCATLSGLIIYQITGLPEGNVVLVSLLYNLTYLGPDALLCLLVCLIPGIGRMVRRLAQRA